MRRCERQGRHTCNWHDEHYKHRIPVSIKSEAKTYSASSEDAKKVRYSFVLRQAAMGTFVRSECARQHTGTCNLQREQVKERNREQQASMPGRVARFRPRYDLHVVSE